MRFADSLLDYLTGDVYKLGLRDMRQIIESGQILGRIWLTNTYGVNTTAFVIIPIRNKMTDQLIIY
jgi:hypothetical protein